MVLSGALNARRMGRKKNNRRRAHGGDYLLDKSALT